MKFRIGEKLAVVGRNGSGKTTFIKLLCRLYDPTEGEILLNGVDIRKYDYAEYQALFSVVFQDFRLLEHSSAFDNVALPLRVCGMNEKEIRKRVNELLKWVEIDRSTSAITSTLSGGEKQRVAIARAVINRPDVLLADEPTGNVDNDIAPKLMKLFVELNKLGTTVVIATHNENLIKEFRYPTIHLKNHGLSIINPEDGDEYAEI